MKKLMTRTHARRLLKLARKLERVPREQFNMNIWWKTTCHLSDGECGTAGCALGWAGRIPTFQKLGLKSRDSFYDNGVVRFAPVRPFDRKTCDAIDNENMGSYGPVYESFEAAERFFGLTVAEAGRLFTPHSQNKTPRQVARNIRRVVARHFPMLAAKDVARRLAAA